MRKIARRTGQLGLLATLFYLIWRFVRSRQEQHPGELEWEAQPFPLPPLPRPRHEHRVHIPVDVTPGGGPESDLPATVSEAWIEPVGGTCPPSHPVKVKTASGIFHLPGGMSYDRTGPDRCYVSAEAAEADGFRPAKR